MNGIITAWLVAGVAASAPQITAENAPACRSAEHRQFDFWVGRWDVFDGSSGNRVGSSVIESLYGGCALRENWSQPGFSGGSLNVYTAADGRWHQTWVDQSGALREFTGGMQGAAMVLVAPSRVRQAPDRPALVRMTFTPNADGSVRQYSDYSLDDGATWALRYDYVYRRAR